MSKGQGSTLLAYLRRLVGGAATDRSDEDLLDRFVAQHDEAAFEALLHRHGALVWNVCRRVLTEEHAAEDAFQATFLVLVRKARSVRKKASIRSWLHGVALRVALRARRQAHLRHRREQETPLHHPEEACWNDVRLILDEEIQRLPEKYRLPVILCYLEGRTNDEAAQLLNCPRGTIATRLSRARERLRSRLRRRGVSLSAGSLAALLTENATSATAPPLLLAQTVKIVLMGATSGSIITLTEGVLHAMFLSKLKMVSTFVLIVAVIGGAGIGAYYLCAQAPPGYDRQFRQW
jgi:RNA polymerase sigma factor (sigma-70 family)